MGGRALRAATLLLPLLLAWPAGAGRARSDEPAKRALLVGISSYDRGGAEDWWDLSSSGDLQAISLLLQRRFGFAPEEILILEKPEETTGDAIVSAFESWLIEPTRPGDVVYFHYSGHGSEMPDDDGDEIDGLDECLIPTDYVSRHDASRNIRDDKLADLLDALAKREPASVTLTFDCCYSGTATRGGRQAIRGQAWRGERPRAATRGGGQDDGPSGLLPGSHPAASHYVVLSATSQGQVASETDDGADGSMGLFTWAFTRAAADAPAGSSYRSLFERIANLMLERNRDQNPQIEGQLDRVLFDGRYAPPPTYLPVTLDPGAGLVLEAGALQGMTVGSRLTIYPAGTMDFLAAEPIARAKVAFADLNYCTLELEPGYSGGATDSIFLAARAVEEMHHYGDDRLLVDLSGLAAWSGRPALLREIEALPLARVAQANEGGWDLRLTGPDAGHIRIEGQDGSLLRELPAGPRASAAVARSLEGAARWRFLSGLENKDPYAQVAIELRVVPVAVERDADGAVTRVKGDLPPRLEEPGARKLAVGEFVMLELRNTGFVDAFVTVLDLKSDGSVGPLWPYPGVLVKDNRILADNEWHRIPEPFVFELERPLGVEVFKAIATAEPADFSPLLDRETIEASPAQRSGGPLGRLLRSAMLGQRGEPALESGNWAVASARIVLVQE